jgi:hypothetical protein
VPDPTPEQEAKIGPHMDKWAAICHATGEADWQAWAAGARKCYEYIDETWPNVVVVTPSPVAGAFISGCLSHLAAAAQPLAELMPVGSALRAYRSGEMIVLRIIKPGEVDDATPAGRLVATGEVRSL